MCTTHRRSPRLSLLLFAVALAGCFEPDVERLSRHLVDNCQVAPAMPDCALGNDEALDAAVADFVRRHVRSATTEQCILDVDCGDGRRASDPDAALTELGRCFDDDEGGGWPMMRSDPACLERCATAFFSCGSPATCGADTVARCTGARDLCEDTCPLVAPGG